MNFTLLLFLSVVLIISHALGDVGRFPSTAYPLAPASLISGLVLKATVVGFVLDRVECWRVFDLVLEGEIFWCKRVEVLEQSDWEIFIFEFCKGAELTGFSLADEMKQLWNVRF